jgi:hypothetical protein
MGIMALIILMYTAVSFVTVSLRNRDLSIKDRMKIPFIFFGTLFLISLIENAFNNENITIIFTFIGFLLANTCVLIFSKIKSKENNKTQ